MENKNLAIINYITIFGWLYVYITTKGTADKLVKYHQRQFLGLFIISVLFSVALNVVAMIVPALAILSFVSLAFVILWIFGLINAINGVEKPIPVVGGMFENKFAFIG